MSTISSPHLSEIERKSLIAEEMDKKRVSNKTIAIVVISLTVLVIFIFAFVIPIIEKQAVEDANKAKAQEVNQLLNSSQEGVNQFINHKATYNPHNK